MTRIKLILVFLTLVLGLNCEKEHKISKRAFLFPRATFLQFTYGVTAPLILPRRSINLSLCCQTNYDLPYNVSQLQTRIIQAKSRTDYDLSREVFYNYIVSFLDGFGLDGEQCLLRAICEISEYPMHLDQRENLLEEIVHFVFTPSLEFEKGNSTRNFVNKLLAAENFGKNQGKCPQKFPECLVPIVDLFTSTFLV